MPSSQKDHAKTRTVTVTFGRSCGRLRTAALEGGTYSDELRAQNYRHVRRFIHFNAEHGEVAYKDRWEHPVLPRVFTSYRARHDVPVPLLYANEVAKADEVWLSESHSDAVVLRNAGVTATTNWGSAHSWNDEDAAQLRGKRVIVVMHRDDAGRDFARRVVASLPGEDVKVVRARRGNDARDHLASGLKLDHFVEVRDA
jgi:hypothetical protein